MNHPDPVRLALPQPPTDKSGWPWEAAGPISEAFRGSDQRVPLISVVVPSFNQGNFIEECIRSVLLQRYPNVELIIIDGGSTDCTVDVLRRYDPWISYWISEPDRGQSHALNKGLRKATGELIGWQNSDDFYGPDNFHQGALASRAYPDYDVYNGTACGFLGFDFHPPWLFAVSQEFSQHSLLDGMCVMNQSMFFRRSIFERGLFVKEDLHYAMDIEYFWRLSFSGCRFKLVPGMIGYYRQHGLAKSNSNVWRGDLEVYGIYRKLIHEQRLDRAMRKKIQRRLRQAFVSSISRAKRTLWRKLVLELLVPV